MDNIQEKAAALTSDVSHDRMSVKSCRSADIATAPPKNKNFNDFLKGTSPDPETIYLVRLPKN